MRLIGEFQHEKQAFEFQLFLQNHGISSEYEQALDPSHETIYRVWVVEEDQFEEAYSYYHERKENPMPQEKPSIASIPKINTHWKVRPQIPFKGSSFSLTHFIIVICAFLFLWSLFQSENLVQKRGEVALEYELIPIQKMLLFDDPVYLADIETFLDQHDIKTEENLKKLSPQLQKEFKQIQDAPTWKGFADMIVKRDWALFDKLPSGTLFGKIREGELWRLISPVLLHGGWLHILFNMAWLFILGRQIEERIGKIRYLALSIILGVVANIAQYFASGPIFLGYSGIITGMVGFIWMRQKLAPWEGYPLQRSVIAFITVFVAIMFGIELISMALQFFHKTEIYPNIANAAHIIGALCGMALGRFPFFARSQK